MLRTLFLPFFGLCFVGCTTITAPITNYTITASPKSSDTAKHWESPLTLKIAGTKTVPSLSSKALLYLTDHQEVGEYLYSRWNDAPTAMIERTLVSSLDESHLFGALIPKSSTANADLILESSLYSFYHRIHENNTSDGFLEITYLLIEQKTNKIVASKRFSITSPAPSIDAHGGVAALNDSTHILSRQCIAWLNLIIKENKWIK